MKNTRKYTAKITGNPLLFSEMKAVASLKLQGLDEREIKSRIIDDNLFHYKTHKSIRKRLNEALRRLMLLDDRLLLMLTSTVSETSKLISLFTILKSDRLFYEFMEEVIGEKHRSRSRTLCSMDLELFFRSKEEQSEQISSWTEYTQRKLKTAYKTILKEVGILKGTSLLEICAPLFPNELTRHLKETGNSQYIRIMLGE